MTPKEELILLKKDINCQIKLAVFLHALSDTHDIWPKIGRNYCKQVCFRNYILEEVTSDRIKAALWFKEQLKLYWSNKKLKMILQYMPKEKIIVEIQGYLEYRKCFPDSSYCRSWDDDDKKYIKGNAFCQSHLWLGENQVTDLLAVFDRLNVKLTLSIIEDEVK